MSCEDYDEWISLSVGGDLHSAALRRLDEHLEGCSRCQQLRDELLELHTSLRQLAELPGAESERVQVRQEVWSRIDRGEGHASPRRVLVAAATGLLLTLAMVSLWPRERQALPPAVDDPAAAAEGVLPAPANEPAARVVHTAPAVERAPISSPGGSEQADPDAHAPSRPDTVEPLVVKLLPNDPDIVIYWIIDPEEKEDGNQAASSSA